jgi:hypothetical protein
MPTYNPLIPSGTVNLDEDYKNIRDNFNQANIVINVDHVPFDNTTLQVGYHKDIHFNPVSTTVTNAPNNYVTATQFPQGVPATVAGIGQLFSSSVNDGIGVVDTGLYWLTGAGKQVALTRNFVPSHAASGRTFLPGGLILQWKTVTSLVSGTTPFTWPFPFTTFFSATLTAVTTVNTDTRIAQFLNTPTVAGGDFYVTNQNNAFRANDVFFLAIGV